MTSTAIDSFDNPLDDGKTLKSYYLRGRTVTIVGTIKNQSAEEFNNELDTIKSHLSQP